MHSHREYDHEDRKTIVSASAPSNISPSRSHNVYHEPRSHRDAIAPAMNPPQLQSMWNSDTASPADIMIDRRDLSLETSEMAGTSAQMDTSFGQSRMAGMSSQWTQNNDERFQDWSWYLNEGDHY